MAALTVQTVGLAGTTPSYGATAGGGDTCPTGQTVFLHVKNGGAGALHVAVDDPTSVTPSGAKTFDPDLYVNVPNGSERMIGPITNRFANASDGLAHITYPDGVTSLTIGVFQV